MKYLCVMGRVRKLDFYENWLLCTCSGLRPGGTQTYSSSAHPESSSEVEFLWKSYISLVMVFSISRDMAVTTCSSAQIASVDTDFPIEERDKKKTTWGIKMPFLFICLFLYVKPAGQDWADWNNIPARDTCIHPCLLIILLSGSTFLHYYWCLEVRVTPG